MSATGGANEDRPRPTIDEAALARQAYEAWERKVCRKIALLGELCGDPTRARRAGAADLDRPKKAVESYE